MKNTIANAELFGTYKDIKEVARKAEMNGFSEYQIIKIEDGYALYVNRSETEKREDDNEQK